MAGWEDGKPAFDATPDHKDGMRTTRVEVEKISEESRGTQCTSNGHGEENTRPPRIKKGASNPGMSKRKCNSEVGSPVKKRVTTKTTAHKTRISVSGTPAGEGGTDMSSMALM